MARAHEPSSARRSSSAFVSTRPQSASTPRPTPSWPATGPRRSDSPAPTNSRKLVLMVIATRTLVVAAIALLAQETKPVPKDSVRVSIPGCTKGYVFTVGSRSRNEAGSNYDIPEGMHLRMNGPKKLINEIKLHEGSMIQLTGIMKKDQYRTDGVGIGG